MRLVPERRVTDSIEARRIPNSDTSTSAASRTRWLTSSVGGVAGPRRARSKTDAVIGTSVDTLRHLYTMLPRICRGSDRLRTGFVNARFGSGLPVVGATGFEPATFRPSA